MPERGRSRGESRKTEWFKRWRTGSLRAEITHLKRHKSLSPSHPRHGNLADLRGANLRKAKLADARLARVDLAEAELYQAYLVHSDLSGSELFDADLCEANLRNAHLNSTSLVNANLRSGLHPVRLTPA
jgi:uncharacterized protein YjbI with pentapeptide repeats